ELFRQLHEAQRLAIPFRVGHAEVSLHALFEGFAFLMTDNHHGAVVEPGESSHDGPSTSKNTIAMQLKKVSRQLSDIVQGAWTLRMSGQLRSLPGSQIFVEFVLGLSKF